MITEQLLEKAREFKREAKRCTEDRAIDSAVVLLSKAAFAIIDCFLFTKIHFRIYAKNDAV